MAFEKPAVRKQTISIQKIGFVLIALSLLWSFYLLSETKFKNEIKDSDYLKHEIVKLSKEYINALSKEELLSPSTEGRSSQQTAILLQNMLDRIEHLESNLRHVIINSTDAFASMRRVIGKLNSTILKEMFNKTGEGFYHLKCEIPSDPDYPLCNQKVEWLRSNWQKGKKYYKHGVNGTLCSFLEYLSTIENHCPRTFKRVELVKHQDESKEMEGDSDKDEGTDDCLIVVTHDFPHCKQKVEWLAKHWKSNEKYTNQGVDGTQCSFIRYLSEVESYCPSISNNESRAVTFKDGGCFIPDDLNFPHCGEKVAWMKKFWSTDPCYKTFGVNGSLCSFLRYLSEVESYCPLFPGRSKKDVPITSVFYNIPPNLDQVNLEKLALIFKRGGPPGRTTWLTERIARLWPQWISAREQLAKRVQLDSYNKKRILVYIGLLADESNYHFAALSGRGGPLGEFVQWSDLIASLYLLGHDIEIFYSKVQLSKLLKNSVSSLCPNSAKVQYDIVYTDYIGMAHMNRKFKNLNNIKCHLRIVDSFGTEARFNMKVPGSRMKKNSYGFKQLNLKQYNTMFPHSPDNSFLGFVVESHVMPNETLEKKPIALVYGKDVKMWQNHKQIAFLDIVRKYFEVHATVGDGGQNKETIKYALPSYVINHGVLKGSQLQELLKKAKVFVGLGFPYEGPAPLEAIASGCFFINVKLDPPVGRLNSPFFKSKPTDRELTSQHPYAERFIGQPYVYTVDVTKEEEVDEAVKEISTKTVRPYLPFEFTHEGMLERLYAFTKHHQFCNDGQTKEIWPPLPSLQTFSSKPDQSCDHVCEQKGLICEPAYFTHINNIKSFNGKCEQFKHQTSLVAPAVKLISDTEVQCFLQNEKQLFSCVSKEAFISRICPCRDYVKGQTALCKDCRA